ncbi:MAG: bifunctional metallophosphatase/5'-nucleotidase, partial [Prevotellaceae bacterium]|nr:bifunctional metallophosphatase/5'-nucleotidase [Prevotellaceae bacterium]
MIKFGFIKMLMLALLWGEGAKDAEITILCTNDMHGSIENFPRLSAYYKKLKAENPHTFLFSDGDLFSGNPLVDHYPEKGYPIVDIMNKTGYCLSSVGNHEFDYGQKTLNDRIEQAGFQFISANIKYEEGAALKPLKPYRTFGINGVTMSVLGLTEVGSGGIPSTHPDNVTGLKFVPPVKAAGEYSFLRSSDVFVVLSHSGVERDVEMAEKYPEIDVILGGHSHTKITNGMVKNGVLITQAYAKLEYVGETRISVKKGKIVSKTNRLVNLNELEDEDPEIRKLVDSYKASDRGNRVIGQAVTKISGKQKLGALMTDALTEMLNLDIAFLNPGGIRINSIPKGDITLNTVYTLDPFGNDVVKMTMSYSEIEKFLLKHQTILVSGITCVITYDGKKKSVKITDRNGAALDKSKKYTVGMNSYIYSTYKFAHEDAGAAMNVNTADVLIEFI